MSFAIKNGLFKLNITDYHAILGIPINADSKQIRLRYLKIAQKLHPDTCKGDKDRKQLASDLLSKLVNPAYKQISQKNSYAEYKLILTQTGNRLAQEADRVTIATEAATELLKSGNKLELVYTKLIKDIVKDQYQLVEEATTHIAQLSELNLVYLMLTQGKTAKIEKSVPAKTTQSQGKTTVQSTKSKNPQPNSSQDSEENSEESIAKSRVDSFIRRAQEYMVKNSYAMAISELKGALKIDPNHSTCHALLGQAYLKQNQPTMAKVHMNKAWNANPKDPVVIECKQLLDKLNKNSNKGKQKSSNSNFGSKSPAKSASGGIFGGLFGTKKK